MSMCATWHFKGTLRFVILNVLLLYVAPLSLLQYVKNGDFVCTFQIFCQTFHLPFNCSAEGSICTLIFGY
jgi:hypothetical protein